MAGNLSALVAALPMPGTCSVRFSSRLPLTLSEELVGMTGRRREHLPRSPILS